MTRCAAFLRAINVGGHTVKMDRLRSLFEEAGYTDVSTLIASGNVIFQAESSEASEIEARIERKLHEALGYAVTTFVRSEQELGSIAACAPFAAAEPGVEGDVYVAFLRDVPAEAAIERLTRLIDPSDLLASQGREIYWHCRSRISDSPAFRSGAFEKALAAQATLRNRNTVLKMAQKLMEQKG